MATHQSPNPYAAATAPKPPSRRRRGWRIALWSLAGLLALVAALAGVAWWWAGGNTSLATTLARVALYLPAGQSLEARDVSGSLRSGGQIGWLRWSSPTMAVEVQGARIGWQLGPLLRRKVQLGEVHAARVQVTPQGEPSTEPAQPLEQLVLPVQVELPFGVDELVWAGPSPLILQHLAGSYRYDGAQHQLKVDGVELAQGRYALRATVQARAPMAIDATLDGTVRSAMPGNAPALEAAAHATVQGTLATAAARLQATAQLRATDAGGDAPQADVQAHIAPWAPQPLLQAQANLRALDLAALWPQAPATQLGGQLRVEPTPTAGWNIVAQLHNALPGPWDRQRLPVDEVQAQATFDGTQWTVPQAHLRIGGGSVALHGAFTPATRAVQARAEVRDLRPNALHSRLDAAPLGGTAQAEGRGDGAVRFSADIRSTPSRRSGTPAPLRIGHLTAEGTWHDDWLELARLQLDALEAQVNARQVRIGINEPSTQGPWQATVPGATVRLDGQLAPRAGQGTLQLQVADAQRLQRWAASLPGLASVLQGMALEGAAQLDARWNGGWHSLQRQLHAAGLAPPPPAGATGTFELQARLAAPRFSATLLPQPDSGAGPLALQLNGVRAEVVGSVPQATLAWDGEIRQGAHRATLHARATAGARAPGQWHAQIGTLRAQATVGGQPGPWTVELAQPLSITARRPPGLLVEASAGQATLSGPVPGQATLRWQPVRYAQKSPGALQLRTQGEFRGLPMAWAEAFGEGGQQALQRLGLAGDLVFDGQWDVDAADTLRASATVRRASGDLRVLAGDAPAVTTVRSSGQGTGAGAPQVQEGPGTPAGVRQAEVRVDAEGDTVRARVQWDSERAGRIQAEGRTRLARASGGWLWPEDAPLEATVHAQLPDVGVWSALAPPGWRVKGTLEAQVALSGTRAAPRWNGTLGADQMALRSLLDGVDLQDGRLRATLRGDRLEITEFRVNGGPGSNARIAGYSGNRTAAPKSGGTLTGTGSVSWGAAGEGSGIAMDFDAEARALQVLVRADRQVSVSGPLQARLRQGQFTLRGKLTTDRATIILPEAGAPTLGADVVVRSAAKDREAAQKAQEAQEVAKAAGRVEAARPPDIAVTLNLGRDFALQGYGITTRLAGELEIRGASVAGAPPRVTGEVRTVEGRYRAWGQALDVETGLARFNGPYDNPALDVLAIRPNISVRAGVQVTGSAKAPRVRLYADPDLPDAEKLSWVVLGRSAAAGGAEAALLQQAALALLGGSGDGGAGNIAKRIGLDEIGFKGPGSGEDASAAALTFGKRLSKDLYVTYERSLSGALGTLYIFYDLSRRLTLRGQTGMQSAVDLVYTLRYD